MITNGAKICQQDLCAIPAYMKDIFGRVFFFSSRSVLLLSVRPYWLTSHLDTAFKVN